MTEVKQGSTDTSIKLKQIIERVEKLEEEKKVLSEDVKEVYSMAKAEGFDTKIVKKLIKLRSQSLAERKEEQELLDLYKAALGMAE